MEFIEDYLKQEGYTLRGPTWYSTDNKISWTDYGGVWGLHIVRNGYADYMTFRIETQEEFDTLLKLINF